MIIQKNILNKLTQYKLGLTRQTVNFTNHTPEFLEAYDFLSHLIKISVSNITTHHIGSTAIPNLITKPILDILVIYHNKTDFLRQVHKLEALGFTPRGEHAQVKDGLGFNFYNQELTVDYAHIHAFQSGHPTIQALLSFRDKLKASPKLAQEYGQLKLDLQLSGISRKDYPSAKTDWIMGVM